MPDSQEAAEIQGSEIQISEVSAKRLGGGLFLLGLLIQLWLSLRSWIYFDQILLYQLGTEGLSSGRLFPYAKAVSGSGVIPGALLEVLVATPLQFWFDLRSPILALGLAQALAGVLLWRTVAGAFDERVGLAYVAVYWLGTWRLYHSGFLWEPTYLLLPAAVHLWASLRLVDHARRGPSLLLGAVAVMAVQIHPSGVVLAASTGLLWLTGTLRLSLPGAGLGALLGSWSLWPTLSALRAGELPRAVPDGSWTDWGLFQLHPLLKDLLYWLRLGSLDVGRRLRQIDLEAPWTGVAAALALLAAASVVLALVANVRYLRSEPVNEDQQFLRQLRRCASPGEPPRGHGLLHRHARRAGTCMLSLLHAASALPVALFVARLHSAQRTGRALRIATLDLRRLFVCRSSWYSGWAHPMYQRPA